jgi:regulator of nucleoside diphosphate kinase
MTPDTSKPPAEAAARKPDILISEAELAHIEALAEGAMKRSPALADRLLDEISRARIVPAAEMPADVVTIGSTVVYRDEVSDQSNTVTLVYPEDADIAAHRVSVMTPIGVALLGLSQGARFFWDTNMAERRMLTILRVDRPAG